jgi:thiol:disulfide interchange protein
VRFARIKMKLNTRRTSLSVTFLAALLFTAPAFSQEPSARDDKDVLEPVSVKKDLYPADADAKKEIENALKRAVTEKKRVLLVFGGNWCYDCHVLDRALHEGSAGRLMKESFLLLHVDIGEGDKNLDLLKKYKIHLDKGVPVVAILSSDGRLLYSSGEGEFEAARRMMKKDLVAFLMLWKESGR